MQNKEFLCCSLLFIVYRLLFTIYYLLFTNIMIPKAIILRGTGTNCDIETAQAFEYVGAQSDIVHINELLAGKKRINDYDILALPGGFSYGDDISAGKIYALKMRTLKKDLEKFIAAQKPLIGICNGFQILVKTGYLPENKKNAQTSTLFLNDAGHFICKWIKVRINKKSPCIFTKCLPEEFELPIAHGEGKFIPGDKKTLDEIVKKNLNALSYVDNPNGSVLDIAGICNAHGNILGLMPHPERTFFGIQTPDRRSKELLSVGYAFFKNAIDYVK